jgi:hypothetical protein
VGNGFAFSPVVLQSQLLPEVFTAGEIARAAGVHRAEVQALLEAGAIESIRIDSRQPFVARAEAVRAGRALAAGLPLAIGIAAGPRPPLFSSRVRPGGPARAPFAISTIVHAGMIAAVVIATSVGMRVQTASNDRLEPQKLRLVYLALPGPGGGGGGGGL